MNIAFVCESLSFGGIERVVSTVSESFAEKKNSVTIITTVDSKNVYSSDNMIEHKQLEYTPGAVATVKVLQKLKNLRYIILNENFDVIIAFGFKSSLFSLLATFGSKNKVIISERTDPESYSNSFLRFLRNQIYKSSALMVCQTNFVESYYREKGLKHIIVIPNPIKPNLPEKVTLNRTTEIVNFCRLNKQKNLHMLIDAFKGLKERYPEYTLSIYGEGDMERELVEYVNKVGLKEAVRIRGFSENIHDLIVDSAMFVSSSNYEGISNSMLESLAIGLPTICTDCPVGGARLVIDHMKNGILTPVGDVEALREAMVYVIENPTKVLKMSEEATKLKTRFSSENIVNKWEESIRYVLDKR